MVRITSQQVMPWRTKTFGNTLVFMTIITITWMIYLNHGQLTEGYHSPPSRWMTSVVTKNSNNKNDFIVDSNGMEDTVNVFLETIIPMEERKKEDEIVYASFGSSVTWGSSVGDRKNLPYVRRLSQGNQERGRNFGLRSTGPNYPAACVYSMIGDNEFDVIILEYFMRVEEGLMTFALRLRERFPNTLIIILRLWGPFQFKDKSNSRISLPRWAKDQGFGTNFIHDPQFHDAFMALDGEEKFENLFVKPDTNQVRIQEEVAKKIGAYIVQMPFNPKAHGPGGWLDIGDHLLADDSFHLSKGGHAVIASLVKDIVDRVGVPKQRKLGQFRGKDNCQNWFESGIIGENLKLSPNSVLYKMPNTEKFVVSFEKNEDSNTDEDTTGWIEISNTSDEIMDLFVSFMTTGPPPSKYPKVEITRSNNKNMRHILDPDAIGWGEKQVHVSQLTHIGHMNPGTLNERIFFQSLEKTEYPFRLTSVALTPVNQNMDEKLKELTGAGLVSVS